MWFKRNEDHCMPSPPSFYGTYGVWHHPCENRFCKGPHHNETWFFMMPERQETWHHRRHKPHGWCHDRAHWRHRMEHHEKNPHNFHEMLFKMHEAYRNQFDEGCSHGPPTSQRFGFCKKSSAGDSENVNSE